jgi:hypothetical protein
MLSKLLQYAQNITNFQLPVSLANTKTEALPSNPTMVTTRRQTRSNSDPATDVSSDLESLPQDVPSASSKKRRRPQAADQSTSRETQDESITRKRQKLPVREKDESQFERHSHIAVEIPVMDIAQDNTSMQTAPEQGIFKEKRSWAEDKPSNSEFHGEDNQNEEEPEDGHRPSPMAKEAVDEDATLLEISEKTSRERGRHKKVGSKPESSTKLTAEPVKVADASKTAKPRHKRFDSEEPAVEEFDQVVEEEAKVEEEDKSSDDDAPEVVATHDAQEKAMVTARSAAKAVEE